MIKTTARNKLVLRRESILRLDAEELAGVHGGTTPATTATPATPAIGVSLRACLPVGQAVWNAAPAVINALKNPPKGNPNNPPSVVTATA